MWVMSKVASIPLPLCRSSSRDDSTTPNIDTTPALRFGKSLGRAPLGRLMCTSKLPGPRRVPVMFSNFRNVFAPSGAGSASASPARGPLGGDNCTRARSRPQVRARRAPAWHRPLRAGSPPPPTSARRIRHRRRRSESDRSLRLREERACPSSGRAADHLSSPPLRRSRDPSQTSRSRTRTVERATYCLSDCCVRGAAAMPPTTDRRWRGATRRSDRAPLSRTHS